MDTRQLVARIAVLAAVLVSVPTSLLAAEANEPPATSFAELLQRSDVAMGDKVRVTYVRAGGELVTEDGKLVRLHAGGLTLERKKTQRAVIAAAIQRIEVREDSPWDGALVGAAVGAVAGMAGIASENSRSSGGFGGPTMGPEAGAVAGGLFGGLLGILGDGLLGGSEVVYERAESAGPDRGSDADRGGARFRSIERRTTNGAGSAPPAVRRFTLTLVSGLAATGGPARSTEAKMRDAGLVSSSCFLGSCVEYPFSESYGNPGFGIEAGYRLGDEFGVGLAWVGDDLGSSVGYGSRPLYQRLRLRHELQALSPMVHIYAERFRLGFGPALYRLRTRELESADPYESRSTRAGLLADLTARVVTARGLSFGVKAQYRLAGSADVGPFAPTNAMQPYRANYNHLFIGCTIGIGS